MPETRLPTIADRAVWEKMSEGRAATRWDNVVDNNMEGDRRRPSKGTVFIRGFGGYKTEMKRTIYERKRLALQKR